MFDMYNKIKDLTWKPKGHWLFESTTAGGVQVTIYQKGSLCLVSRDSQGMIIDFDPGVMERILIKRLYDKEKAKLVKAIMAGE